MGLNMISNYAANVAHRNLTATDSQMTSSLAKLSSGSRVVSAKDDAAAMAIGSRISSEVAALKQASVNAGQASSMLQIADGAMARVSDIMTRMKTLAVQASSGQLGDTERSMLDTEYQALKTEIDRIAMDTDFNGNKLVGGEAVVDTALDGDGVLSASISKADTYTIAAGGAITGALGATGTLAPELADLAATGGTVSTTLSDGTVFTLELSSNTIAAGGVIVVDDTASFTFKLGTGTATDVDTVTFDIDSVAAGALGIDETSIDTATNADAAITAVGNAINKLNTARANVGASQNRLEFAASNLATTIENQESARSALLDLDVAAEMTTFTSRQILMQAGVSMLAQANQMPQNLTKLLG